MKCKTFPLAYFLLFVLSIHVAFATEEQKAKATASAFPLTASYKVDTVWATAYQATVTLKNTTQTPTSTWTATFDIPQGYVLSSHVSGGTFKLNGQTVTVQNLSTNGAIPAGGSVTFNMIINMPLSGKTVINNLAAAANGAPTPPPPPQLPTAPVLNSISMSNSTSYNVSWNSVANATSYVLEQDQTASFSNPKIVLQANNLSKVFTNQAIGTYFYRVAAINSAGKGPYSNIQSVTITDVTPPPPPPTTLGIEHSAWYIDWTTWFTGPTFVIPRDVNMLNIFVGEITYGPDGKPTMGGFGTFTLPQLDAFVKYCAAQNPPIPVKVSIGGSGGMYDHCWDRLTSANVASFAQGMADFCHAHGLVGVDFDYEAFASAAQETLVGTLIKQFKQIDPKFQTSLCTNAGFGPNFPWQKSVKNILDAATIAPGNCAVDRLYIMSYYNPIEDEKKWILGWADWVKQNYGFTPARVAVGIDDFDAHAYDPVVFANWAASMGFSTAHWAFDPARP